MSACPVVRIVSPDHAEYGGFVEINESDYDPDKHELFTEGEEADKPRRGRPAKAKE